MLDNHAACEAARFRALAEATADVVWRTDAHGRALEAGRWPALTGQPPEEVAGYGWQAAVHPDDLARMRDEWHTALRERRPYSSVYRHLAPTGAPLA